MDDLVSVIVPVYNVAAYLDRCVSSIVEQTYSNLEILLVDNGSADGSSEICDLWAQKDSRVFVFHEGNIGVSGARNLGMHKSNGKYLMFVDSDDFLGRDAVQTLYNCIVLEESDMVIGNGLSVDESGEVIGDLYAMVEDAYCTQQAILNKFYEIPCMVWGKLYRREVIKDLSFPPLTSGEDLWMLYDVVSKCKSVSLCSKTIYYYTQRMSSIVHTLNDKKLFDSTSAAVYVCKKMVETNYWDTAKKFFSVALFRAVDMENPVPARKLLTEHFSWYMQMRLGKVNFHTMVRLGALYIPMLHYLLKKRHAAT